MNHPLPPVTKALRHKIRATLNSNALAPETGEMPPSPCISVCKMDEARQYCLGCLRTLEELRAWGSASAETKRHIWQQVLLRCESSTSV